MALVLSWFMSRPADAADPGVFLSKDWRVAALKSQGVNSAKLNKVLALLDQQLGCDCVSEALVMRNRYLIWQGKNVDACHKI